MGKNLQNFWKWLKGLLMVAFLTGTAFSAANATAPSFNGWTLKGGPFLLKNSSTGKFVYGTDEDYSGEKNDKWVTYKDVKLATTADKANNAYRWYVYQRNSTDYPYIIANEAKQVLIFRNRNDEGAQTDHIKVAATTDLKTENDYKYYAVKMSNVSSDGFTTAIQVTRDDANRTNDRVWDYGNGYLVWRRNGENPNNSNWQFVDANAVEPPANFSATANGTSQIDLSWDAVDNAKVYGVYRSTTETGTYKAVGSTKTNSFSDKNLEQGTTYYYKVKVESLFTLQVEDYGGSAINKGYYLYEDNSLLHLKSYGSTPTATNESEAYWCLVGSYFCNYGSGKYVGKGTGTVESKDGSGSYSNGDCNGPCTVVTSSSVNSEESFNWSKIDVAKCSSNNEVKIFGLVANTNKQLVSGRDKSNGGLAAIATMGDAGTGSCGRHWIMGNATFSTDFSDVKSAETEQAGPDAPEVAVTSKTTYSMTLSWDEVTDATGYNIYNGDNEKQNADEVTGTSFTIENLTHNTQYTYYVKAYDAQSQESKASNSVSESTLTLATPVKPTAYDAVATSMQIQWSAAENATSYTLYYCKASDSPNYTTAYTGSGLSYKLEGLTESTKYYFYLTATDGYNNETQSETGEAETTGVTPEITSVECADGQGLKVTWSYEGSSQKFNVYRSKTQTGEYTAVATEVSGKSYTDNTVKDGVTYYYKVAAVKEGVVVEELDVLNYATNSNAPGNDQNSAKWDNDGTENAWKFGTSDGSGKGFRQEITFNYNDDKYKTYYIVMNVKASANGKEIGVALCSNQGGNTITTYAKYAAATTKYSDVVLGKVSDFTNMKNGLSVVMNTGSNLDYFYIKRLYLSNIDPTKPQEGDRSAAVSGSCPEIVPEITSVECDGNDALKISWTYGKEADVYNVYRSESEDSGFELIASDVESLYYTDNTLTDEKTYYYAVSAVTKNDVDMGDGSEIEVGANTTLWISDRSAISAECALQTSSYDGYNKLFVKGDNCNDVKGMTIDWKISLTESGVYKFSNYIGSCHGGAQKFALIIDEEQIGDQRDAHTGGNWKTCADVPTDVTGVELCAGVHNVRIKVNEVSSLTILRLDLTRTGDSEICPPLQEETSKSEPMSNSLAYCRAVAMVESTLYKTLTEAVAVAEGKEIVLMKDTEEDLNVEKQFSVKGEGFSVKNVQITKDGNLTLTSDLTAIGDFYIESVYTAGGYVSGEYYESGDAELALAGDAFVDITLDPVAGNDNKWYGFTVPFPVSSQDGVYQVNGESVAKGVWNKTYLIKGYDGEARANSGAGWINASGDLVPGAFYMIGTDGSNTYRFKKTAGGAFVTDNTPRQLNEYASANAVDAGWNALGNSALYNVKVSADGLVYAQVYENGTPGSGKYTTVEIAEASFAVACPFFVQYVSGMGDLSQSRSQQVALESLAPYSIGFGVQVASVSNGSDVLFVTASSDATNTYEIGPDVAKLGDLGKGSYVQLWVNAYNGVKLSACDKPLTDAEYDLSIYAPKAGEYTLAANEKCECGAMLYLTKNGKRICDLSDGDYALALNKGVNNEYALQLVLADKPTEVETITKSGKSISAQDGIVTISNLEAGDTYTITDINGKEMANGTATSDIVEEALPMNAGTVVVIVNGEAVKVTF